MTSTVFEPMNMATAETVLKEAKQLLDQLGLTFFLRHGTCLGAVRDKAFIPWDDDLDIGSIIGMHGLTEEKVHEAADVFKQHGFTVRVEMNELNLSVDMQKYDTQLDWTCYRVIDGNIYQWPVVKIPATLHDNLKPIDFLGTEFMVPNPPEEYFLLKYGPGWETPQKAGEFEQGILDLINNAVLPDGAEGLMQMDSVYESSRHSGSIKVIDMNGEPVHSAEVSLAATSVLTGLHKSNTNKDGFVYFDLPATAGYVVAVSFGGTHEILYLEHLAPNIDYVYRPDPEVAVGRVDALIAQEC
jgi:hypothetical protein